MVSVADVLFGIHLTVLTVFVGVTSVAMLVAVLSRLRIPRTLCVWRRGPLTSVPIGPSLFLLAVGLGFGWAAWAGVSIPPYVLIGYPAGGVFWAVATWLIRSVVLTEYGLVPNIHRLHKAVAWRQVVDYFVVPHEGRTRYSFLYVEDGVRKRLDVSVPAHHEETVRRIVEGKLDVRFSASTVDAPNVPFDE